MVVTKKKIYFVAIYPIKVGSKVNIKSRLFVYDFD